MTRTLAAVLALSAGLTAVPALAQPYPQGGYPQGGYPQGSYPQQPDSGRPSSQYDRQDDRGYQPPPPPPGYEDRRDDDRRNDGGPPPPPPYGDRRTDSTPTYPDRYDGDRRYESDPRQVDPAPGARGPYVGVGPQRFYDVEDRMARIESRLAGLTAAQRRRAYAEFRAIRAEAQTQRGRHGGELRDWDREHLNQRLDALIRRYPRLGA